MRGEMKRVWRMVIRPTLIGFVATGALLGFAFILPLTYILWFAVIYFALSLSCFVGILIEKAVEDRRRKRAASVLNREE